MSERLNTIIALFEDDNGVKFNPSDREEAKTKWDALHPDDRKFLEELTVEDLSNVCIGERRGLNSFLYRGLWQPLPPAVDYFLEEVWEIT